MKKIKIECDEWYPVWAPTEFGDFVEIADDDYDFITQAFKDFKKAQKLLKNAWDKRS